MDIQWYAMLAGSWTSDFRESVNDVTRRRMCGEDVSDHAERVAYTMITACRHGEKVTDNATQNYLADDLLQTAAKAAELFGDAWLPAIELARATVDPWVRVDG